MCFLGVLFFVFLFLPNLGWVFHCVPSAFFPHLSLPGLIYTYLIQLKLFHVSPGLCPSSVITFSVWIIAMELCSSSLCLMWSPNCCWAHPVNFSHQMVFFSFLEFPCGPFKTKIAKYHFPSYAAISIYFTIMSNVSFKSCVCLLVVYFCGCFFSWIMSHIFLLLPIFLSVYWTL